MSDKSQTTHWKPIASVPDGVNRILGTHTAAPGAIIYLHRVTEQSGFSWADRDGVIWCPSHWLPAPKEIGDE